MTAFNHPLADDSPGKNPWQDDALGFAPFAKRLAIALARQAAPTGYVFGLHGEWGAGKSTVLNFVRAYLGKWSDESQADMQNLQWFNFEPWIVAGHQDLAAAFFKVLSEKLGDRAEAKGATRRFMRGVVDAGAGKLIDAAAKLGAAIDHTGGAASKASAEIAKFGIKKAAEKWLSEPSIQKTYEALVTRLEQSDQRFIVFVDDIDRLTSAEIRSLMQMVKTVGRLPNVTYCLAYDRRIVWTALRDLAPGEGPRSGYAEKIVQHELEVPVPSRMGLMRMLDAGLPEMPPAPSATIRWVEMLQAGLNRWIRHPRDVVRLSNAMHFTWTALDGEVDAHDVLCMEALRLFDRKAFDWIRDNRDLLLGEGYPRLVKEEETEAAAEELARTLSEDARAEVLSILRILFPTKTKLFGAGRGFSNERWEDVVSRRGIATKPGFTAYFSLSASPDAVPKRMIDEAVASNVSRERHAQLIDRAIELTDGHGNSLVGEYFQELSHRVSKLSRESQAALLQALVERSVSVFEADDEAGVFGPASAHHILTGQLFQALGPETLGEILQGLFNTIDDVGALAAVYVDLARAMGVIKTEGAGRHQYISREQLSALGMILLPKIEAAAEADTLSGLPHYYEVARAWAHVGDIDAARTWLARESTRNGHTLAKISRGLLGGAVSGTEKTFGLYRDPDTDLYDIDALEAGCSAFIEAEDLSPTERARIAALCDGLDRLRRLDMRRSASDGGE
ncbi:MAG: hypothetical protein H2055_09525 [Sphingopyxis sp.]|nr:hypothetical protein [Sphingopyxis sp.]